MISVPYTNRDFSSIFNDVKQIIETIEPRADVDIDKANVESIITKIVAGVVDTLSYNQDANILECFPSTAKNSRSIFDLLSIVGYTPKTARSCTLNMTLWNPSYEGEVNYYPFRSIMIDGKTFYNPDAFRCAQGITTDTIWYQGTLTTPDRNFTINDEDNDNFLDIYYPNLSVNTIKNNQFKLPEEHTNIDSRTIRVYAAENNEQLTYVENPYMTNITKSSFSILPSINKKGYSLVFSKDVSNGVLGDNFYYFYVISDGYDVGNNLVPDFGGLATSESDNMTPSFSYSYSSTFHKDPETAAEARENVVYEFGWRDTPKAIITKHDAERAVLQNFDYISAVSVRDGNDYSKCDPSNFDIQIFCKVNEETERTLNITTADSIKNRLQTHFSKFKSLPLEYEFHIDNVETYEGENVTQLYYWYPDVTVYLKEQVDSQEAAAIINSINEALYTRFSTINMNYNEVPRIVDVIDTIQNASAIILYLDIDGITYIDTDNNEVDKEIITCSFTQTITKNEDSDNLEYTVMLNNRDNHDNIRNIQYNTVKIVNNYNEVLAYDNGDGVIISYGSSYLDGQGTINYETGELKFTLSAPLADDVELLVSYRQETPCFCEYIALQNSIKIALESLKP